MRHLVQALLPEQDTIVNIQLSLAPIIALLAGILILVQPRLLNYIVAIYLIVIGLLGLFGAGAMRLQ
jgi:threonine/homoserine efflux transporter RhtA